MTSRLEALVAKFLQFFMIDYEYRKRLRLRGGGEETVDFFMKERIVEVVEDASEGQKVKRKLARIKKSWPGFRTLLVCNDEVASDFKGLDIPLVNLASDEPRKRTSAIFLEDPAFGFDYSHFLPRNDKCYMLHGHSSTVYVEINGVPNEEGVIVDFALAKDIVRRAVETFDHKLLVGKKYVVGRGKGGYRVEFRRGGDVFSIKVPKDNICIMDGEATIENMSEELLRLIVPKMPENVESVTVLIHEGVHKGAKLKLRMG